MQKKKVFFVNAALAFFHTEDGGRKTRITKPILRFPVAFGYNSTTSNIIKDKCKFIPANLSSDFLLVDGTFLFNEREVEPGDKINCEIGFYAIDNLDAENFIRAQRHFIVREMNIIAYGQILEFLERKEIPSN